MALRKHLSLIVDVSRLYYEQGLTQAQIAKQLAISRPVVSKYLAEARARGIVKIEIRSPLTQNQTLHDELIEAFELEDCLIVPSGDAKDGQLARLIATEGAAYLEPRLRQARSIGIGWGNKVALLIDEIEAVAENGNGAEGVICPLIGIASNNLRYLQANELARTLADKLGYKPFYLHAPAFPRSPKDKSLFEETSEYSVIVGLWSALDTIVLEITSYMTVPDQATAVRFGNLLRECNAAGMMVTYCFDEAGEFIRSENDVVTRISSVDLKSARQVYAIVAGGISPAAVVGALRTGWVSHLIADEQTAVAVLNRLSR